MGETLEGNCSEVTGNTEDIGVGAEAEVLAPAVIGIATVTVTVMIMAIGMVEDLIGLTVTSVVGENMEVLNEAIVEAEAEALHLLGKGVKNVEPGLNNGIEKGKRSHKSKLFRPRFDL